MSEEQEDRAPTIAPEFTKYDSMPTIDVCRAMARLKAEYDRADATKKELGREYDFLRLLLVPKRFEEEGINLLKIEGVGRVGLTADVYVAIPKESKEEVYQWMRDTGREACIVETVNSSTLKALVKEVFKKGMESLPACMKVTPFTRASITKASGSSKKDESEE